VLIFDTQALVKTASYRCQRAVIAEKQFTLHDAPMVLTVHLKRFSPLGRKIGHHVDYDDRISLKPVMSEGQHGPTYSLYGVICHAGGGPNSGHYIAHVKGRSAWYEMNDDMVSPNRHPPTNLKSAYMLFYLRDKGQTLDAALSSSSLKPPIPPKGPNVMAAMKRRKVVLSDDEDEEDTGVKATQPFIGPQLPTSSPVSPHLLTKPDPQAEQLKKRIEAAKKPQEALLGLSQYADSDDGEDRSESSTKLNGVEPPAGMAIPSSPAMPPPSSPLVPSPVISPTNFYASSAKARKPDYEKKRKSPDSENDNQSYSRRPFTPKSNTPASPLSFSSRRSFDGSNPFNRMKPGSNFGSRTQTYGNKKKRRMGI
jgi:ubiquitin carboxyl-terminal hydrolase 36/42